MDTNNNLNIKVCYKCGSNKSCKAPYGGIQWIRNKEAEGTFLCKSCHIKSINSGENNPMYGVKRINHVVIGKTGNENPNWKGGVTPIQQAIRNSDRYKAWRIACMKRDDYRCNICGKRGGKLEVNHIIRFAEILRVNNIFNISDAFKCEELWDLNNGETLCYTCHKHKYMIIHDILIGIRSGWVFTMV